MSCNHMLRMASVTCDLAVFQCCVSHEKEDLVAGSLKDSKGLTGQFILTYYLYTWR